MTCYAGTFTTLAATGPADNWSGNTYLLSDPDGDNVWEGTYSVTNNFIYMLLILGQILNLVVYLTKC